MKRISYLFAFIAMLGISKEGLTQDDQRLEEDFLHDKKSKKSAFESTMWMPKRGVKLLEEEYALKTWKEVQDSDCYIPKLTDESLRSFDVFQSEHLNIFVFTTWEGTDWTICQKGSNVQEFQADNISGGYRDSDPKKTFDNCSSGSIGTDVRFRSYVKDGPLLLEVHVGGCREGEAHHEFLFRLDKNTLEEIPGSRLVMHDYYNKSEISRGWMWSSSSYSRLGKKSWNDDGELVWERFLRKHPLEFVVYGAYELQYEKYKPSIFKRTCSYDSVEWEVKCEDELKKKAYVSIDVIDYYLEFKDIYRDDEHTLRYLESIRIGLEGDLKDLGYDMKNEEKKKLNNRIDYLKKNIERRKKVKTTTR